MRKTPLVAAAVVAVAVLAINASMASSATTLDLVFGPERETKEVAFDTNGNGLRLGSASSAALHCGITRRAKGLERDTLNASCRDGSSIRT
jgi:hypothetical protein